MSNVKLLDTFISEVKLGYQKTLTLEFKIPCIVDKKLGTPTRVPNFNRDTELKKGFIKVGQNKMVLTRNSSRFVSSSR